jgi:hypothetical protein
MTPHTDKSLCVAYKHWIPYISHIMQTGNERCGAYDLVLILNYCGLPQFPNPRP